MEPILEGPIRRPRVSDQIVERLEYAICSGAVKIGDVLPSERDLMKSYGVGRPAVREALYTLAKRGIIELRSGSRPLVIAPDASAVMEDLSSTAQPDGVRNFQNLREYLEISLVRDAAKNATEAEIDGMKEALAANKKAIGNRKAFIQTDIDLHFAFASRTQNPIIVAIHNAMTRWLYEQRTVALHSPQIEQISYAGHEAIVRAVASRDPDAAEAAIRAHLHDVSDNYWAGRAQGVPGAQPDTP